MFDKYKGEWRFHFVTITTSGDVSIEAQGKYNFPAIDSNGKITGAKDKDGKELEGNFSTQGPLDVIRLKRKDGERHFRGVKALERPLSTGQRQIVLVGQRSKSAIPEERMEGAELTDERMEDEDGERGRVLRQEEGVWIATKP